MAEGNLANDAEAPETITKAEIRKIDDAAKQLVTITALLPGIFFAAVSLSSVRQNPNLIVWMVFLGPVLLWLACLLFSTLVFIPRRYKFGDEATKAARRNDRFSRWGLRVGYIEAMPNVHQESRFRELVHNRKLVYLWIAYGCLLLGLGLLLVDVGIYPLVIPTPTASPACLPLCTSLPSTLTATPIAATSTLTSPLTAPLPSGTLTAVISRTAALPAAASPMPAPSIPASPIALPPGVTHTATISSTSILTP